MNRVNNAVRFSPTVVLVVAGLWALFVILSRVDFVPLWDGRVYADCIKEAARNFSLASLRCAGHASQAYVAFAAAVQAVAPESYLPLYLGNVVLIAASVVAFCRIATLAFPAPDLSLDRALLSAAFAVQPAMLGAALQPTLDLPLVPAFLWSVVFLLQQRPVPLLLTGIVLCFTKETGVLLYVIVLVCWALWTSHRRMSTATTRAKFLAIASIPLVVFAGYVGARWAGASGSESVVWNTSTTGDSVLRQFLIPRLDLHLIKYAALIFVLGFAWIPTAALFADAFVGAVHAGHRQPARDVPGSDRAVAGLLVLLALGVVYGLTRFTTFGHVRYFLVIPPLLALTMMVSLLRLRVPVTARRAWLIVFVIALALSDVRTVDPVSRRLYGTFSFGSHSMLRMTHITGECCGYGQDQLAYSAQVTVLSALVDSAIADMRVFGPIPVVVPDSTVWLFDAPPRGWITAAGTPRLVLPVRGVSHLNIVDGSVRPDSAYYLATPNGDNDRVMAQLATLYEFRDERRYERGGYALSSYRLVLRMQPGQ